MERKEDNLKFLGIDVGSVSSNMVLTNCKEEVVASLYMKTDGDPVNAIRKGFRQLSDMGYSDAEIGGCGATGSARKLVGAITGCDIVKNEISAHACAAITCFPEVKTVVEIGGQDSKIIIIQNEIVCDFAMNTVCAAGTGAFLEAQALRLDIPVEQFGEMALKASSSVSIAGRCTVFAESDMIHKQQVGYPAADIINGLCRALIRNYMNNVAKGKNVQAPVLFQGGVSENVGIRKALSDFLGFEVIVPEHNKVMGALGIAIMLGRRFAGGLLPETAFRGLRCMREKLSIASFQCDDCSNRCDVMEVRLENIMSRWNSRCGKWDNL